MKLSYILIPALLLAGPALAQSRTIETPGSERTVSTDPSRPAVSQGPTAEQIEYANGIISALRQQRDDANDRLAQAMAANAKLTRDLDAAKKAAEPKKDDAK